MDRGLKNYRDHPGLRRNLDLVDRWFGLDLAHSQKRQCRASTRADIRSADSTTANIITPDDTILNAIIASAASANTDIGTTRSDC